MPVIFLRNNILIYNYYLTSDGCRLSSNFYKYSTTCNCRLVLCPIHQKIYNINNIFNALTVTGYSISNGHTDKSVLDNQRD